ncbi:DUF2207 family protein [Homoserinimonas aerilata]|uniref:DUF2207 family protein n=1 Tax=Homoserinimonas aerilata TaxID=1162970 RepID=UPI001FE6238B|nr:DUF2207 domain-containing protein [Homoserinimonas aerilata]
MKRLILVITAALGLAVGLLPATAASADVDDFSFASFDGQYHLGTDAEGRSTLRVVETIVAVFPDFDQNRGIRRILVDRYDGHPTGLNVVSVVDEAGQPREYELDGEELTIAGDDYVHGEQTYVIEYTQQDVTRYFSDTDADEFYWDVNGVDWSQQFGEVTATVQLEASLEARLTGDVTAVSGSAGEAQPATVDGLSFAAHDLSPGETLTFAIGFEPGTFEARDGGFGAAPWPSVSLGAALLALLGVGGAGVLRATRLRDAPGRGIIVPEYLPPKGVGVLMSALVAGKTAHQTPAQIIALAVAGNIRIVELGSVKEGKKGRYRLDFVTADGAGDYERGMLHALFGKELTPGEHRELGKADSTAAGRIAKLVATVPKDAVTQGYRRKVRAGAISAVLGFTAVAAVVGALFAVISLDQAYGGAWPGLFLGASITAVVVACILLFRTPLDEKGVELKEYLTGLEQYIALAEADRIRFLQSPEGALREPIATDDEAQLVKLNERLLPYAMLFGHEKRWAQELGVHYENLGTQPGWYAGHSGFNAVLFASSIGSVATSTASSYSASSGGSSGGAMAGGGGGGGGGGGV